MRFLPAVAALTPADVAFDGDPRARERPVGALLSALRSLGVSIDDGGRGALPFTVYGTGTVRGGAIEEHGARPHFTERGRPAVRAGDQLHFQCFRVPFIGTLRGDERAFAPRG